MSQKEIDELKAEVAELKKAMTPPKSMAELEAEARQHMAEMHRLREANAGRWSSFSREQIAEMDKAAPASTMQDVVRRGGIPGPSAAGTSGDVTAVHPSPGLPGSNRGWREASPIGPPPGVAACDRLMDHQDMKDRVELAAQHAKMEAARKLAEGK